MCKIINKIQNDRSNKIQEARIYAIKKHGLQMYGTFPYVYHLDMVFNILVEFNITDQDILVASYLHDVLEDTKTTKEEIDNLFGDKISNLVEAVTGRGINRKARILNAYEKIKILGDDAATLKLSDRLANWRSSCAHNPDLKSMYLKEYPLFRFNLAGLGDPKLFSHLCLEFEKVLI